MVDQTGAINQSMKGSRAILNFGAGNSFVYPCENGDDEFWNQPEKKRRLSMDQVQFLEKCFTADNKLEPDRKIQIAKELGLQPRQITIWFQNRRARWKTRQLETDYEALHRSYERLKTEYDALFNDHEKLKAEVLFLRSNNSEPDLEVRGYGESSKSRRVIIADELKSCSVMYEEDLLFGGEFLCTLDPDYPNTNADESMQSSGYLLEVSNGSGFYLEFPVEEDHAPGSWFD